MKNELNDLDKQLVNVADEVISAHHGEPLTDLQRSILEKSLLKERYEAMEVRGYQTQTIKNEGQKLWKLLSEALGEQVSKTNFRGALQKRKEVGIVRSQSPIRFVPTSYLFPKIEFSLINTSDKTLQITSVLAIPCAKIKFETRSIHELPGARVHLELDLERLKSPQRLAGEKEVFNLHSEEAEAFALEMNCENSLNLICLEVQIINRETLTPQKIIFDPIILCAAASDRYPGAVISIPRQSAVNALFEDEDDNNFWDILPEVPSLDTRQELKTICFRGIAFLCYGDLPVWERLRTRFGNTDNWGSILASFAEYSLNYSCSNTITSYLDRWLSSPEKVKQIEVWDNEVRAETVLVNRVNKIPQEERGKYLLRILDATVETLKLEDLSSDEQALRFMSLAWMRSRAAHLLAEYYGQGAIKALIAFLLTEILGITVSEKLKELTGAELQQDSELNPDKEATEWINWWKIASTKFPSTFVLEELAPIMARTLDARMALSQFANYFNDHPIVRKNLALNPNIGIKELAVLAKDKDQDVRVTIAQRANIPTLIAQQLVHDSDVLVRRNLVWNRTINLSIIQELRHDGDEIIKQYAKQILREMI